MEGAGDHTGITVIVDHTGVEIGIRLWRSRRITREATRGIDVRPVNVHAIAVVHWHDRISARYTWSNKKQRILLPALCCRAIPLLRHITDDTRIGNRSSGIRVGAQKGGID